MNKSEEVTKIENSIKKTSFNSLHSQGHNGHAIHHSLTRTTTTTAATTRLQRAAASNNDHMDAQENEASERNIVVMIPSWNT